MESDQEALRKRVMGDKSPLEYLHHQATTNPRSPLYKPKRHNKTPEKDFQREVVIPWLVEQGVCHFELVVKPSMKWIDGKLVRIPSPMKGWPDVNCVIQGKYVGLEMKAKSAQSYDQKIVQEKVESAGGLYYIVRTFEDLERLVKPLLKPHCPICLKSNVGTGIVLAHHVAFCEVPPRP